MITWLGQGQNAAAVQALTAIAITVLTAVLIGVTWWYAGLTQKMAKTMQDQASTMQQQMIAAFQPSVALGFSFRATGSSGTPTGTEHMIGGFVLCTNNGQQPVKVASLTIDVTFQDGTLPKASMIIDGENLIIAPGANKQFVFDIVVPEAALELDHRRYAKLWCSDLAGVSQHTFAIADGDNDVSHYLGFK